jgi:DNA-directed RNA polymerase specialized sigma24 family protein
MYATIPNATSSTTFSLVPTPASQTSLDAAFRKNLGAVYARRSGALRDLARTRVRNGADSWDAVQDAFLHVLEHPPSDTSERALSAALEAAVRTSCGRHATRRREDEALRIALRKRFPV